MSATAKRSRSSSDKMEPSILSPVSINTQEKGNNGSNGFCTRNAGRTPYVSSTMKLFSPNDTQEDEDDGENKAALFLEAESENVDTSNCSLKNFAGMFSKKGSNGNDKKARSNKADRSHGYALKTPLRMLYSTGNNKNAVETPKAVEWGCDTQTLHDASTPTVYPSVRSTTSSPSLDDKDEEELAEIYAHSQQQRSQRQYSIPANEWWNSIPSGRWNPAIPNDDTFFFQLEEGLGCGPLSPEAYSSCLSQADSSETVSPQNSIRSAESGRSNFSVSTGTHSFPSLSVQTESDVDEEELVQQVSKVTLTISHPSMTTTTSTEDVDVEQRDDGADLELNESNRYLLKVIRPLDELSPTSVAEQPVVVSTAITPR